MRLRKRNRLAKRLPPPRRGIALFLAMFFVAGIGALALSAIYLTANASLLSRSYEKEDDLKYASEAALAIGKASLNYNPAALPNTSYVAMMTHKTLIAADNQPINGITVNLYVGPTGSTSGQFGRFASLVSEARDLSGTGFVRRLELNQESFAKYAYWSNHETNNGSPIYFANGDQLWGPVWSNDNINIAPSGATFHDVVGTAGVINGAQYGTFAKGYTLNQKPIQLPSLSSLASLSGLASVGGMNYTAPTTGNETTVLRRIEFVATDLDADGDSTGTQEGFYRVYTANTGNQAWLRGDWPGTLSTLPTAASVTMCGDWHPTTPGGALKFFPVAVHVQSWFDTVTAGGLAGGVTSANITAAHTEGNSGVAAIMQHAGARCFLGGDPHLVAVARTTALGYTVSQIHKGGEDSTFTPTDQYGSWLLYSNTPVAALNAVRQWDSKYMFPLYRGFNTGTKGVIYVNGTVGVSGVLRSDLTLYSPYTVVILDDLRYANDPAKGLCVDILGIIAGNNVIVADNALNSPQYLNASGSQGFRSLDDTPDLVIHAVLMALNTSFAVQNYSSGPTNAIGCLGSPDGRGCLYLTGGVIQNDRGPVGTGAGYGFVKRYSYDRCAVINPPPYYPTTGRFLDNRYYELDPVRFNVAQLFKSLAP